MARRVLLAYLTLTAVVLLILEVPLGITYRDRQLDDLRAGVQADAVVLASFAEDGLESGRGASEALRSLATSYTKRTGGRVVVVDGSGSAVLDTEPRPGDATPRDFASRPEIRTALAGRVQSGIRWSDTLHANLLYVAVPVASSGVVHGAVRVTFPTSAVDARVRRNWLTLALIAAATLMAATAAGVALARWVVRPLRTLEAATTALGHGALGTRIASPAGPPELRRLAQAVNETAARLEELVGSQEAFVADASHQLRTPLTSLRLRLELLETSLADRPAAGDQADQTQQADRADQAEQAAAALREVARLSRLVDGLLALARAERTGASATAEPVDLGALLRERAEAWQPVAEDESVHLEVGTTAAMALATPDRLAQVVDNLIANAIEASSPGSTVRVEARSMPHSAEIHVVDQGRGLTDEERARAFDRFWSGRREPGRLGGSGLGLSIVRKLVEADGGQVALHAGEGGGIDATVVLPRPAARGQSGNMPRRGSSV